MELIPGLKIQFHGGWDGKSDRCSVCNFQCGYISPGVVVEPYHVWDGGTQTFIIRPNNLWVAHLEEGSYAVGYPEQFEVVDPT